MKKLMIPVGLVLALMFACDKSKSAMTCGDYTIKMSFSDQGSQMSAIINGISTDFVLVESASGAKYDGVFQGQEISLWGKGDTWTMFVDQNIVIECK